MCVQAPDTVASPPRCLQPEVTLLQRQTSSETSETPHITLCLINNIVKMAILPKAINIFNTILIKILTQFSQTLKEQHQTSYRKKQKPQEI